jgi:hypothetical protein
VNSAGRKDVNDHHIQDLDKSVHCAQGQVCEYGPASLPLVWSKHCEFRVSIQEADVESER